MRAMIIADPRARRRAPRAAPGSVWFSLWSTGLKEHARGPRHAGRFDRSAAASRSCRVPVSATHDTVKVRLSAGVLGFPGVRHEGLPRHAARRRASQSS